MCVCIVSNCKPARAKSYATNSKSAELLWNLSSQLVLQLESSSHFSKPPSYELPLKGSSEMTSSCQAAKSDDVLLMTSSHDEPSTNADVKTSQKSAEQDEPSINAEVSAGHLGETKMADDRSQLMTSRSVGGVEGSSSSQAVGLSREDDVIRAR